MEQSTASFCLGLGSLTARLAGSVHASLHASQAPTYLQHLFGEFQHGLRCQSHIRLPGVVNANGGIYHHAVGLQQTASLTRRGEAQDRHDNNLCRGLGGWGEQRARGEGGCWWEGVGGWRCCQDRPSHQCSSVHRTLPGLSADRRDVHCQARTRGEACVQSGGSPHVCNELLSGEGLHGKARECSGEDNLQREGGCRGGTCKEQGEHVGCSRRSRGGCSRGRGHQADGPTP